MTPFHRVIAQRPAPQDVLARERELDRWITVTWAEHAVERDNIREGDGDIAVGPELTRDDDQIRYLATVSFNYTGAFSIVLDVRRGRAQPSDDGTCELGPIITGVWSSELEWYAHGADVVALRAAGVRLSWESAQWLYAVGRDELDELHAQSLAISTSPRHIRLRLVHTPFTKSRKDPSRDLDVRDGPSDDDFEPPPVFAFVGTQRGSASSHARDHALLAFAVGGLTRHPDPQIDRLLHDPDPAATQALRDLLLQRGQPIEPLLHDRANVHSLAGAPLVDLNSIDEEFESLWEAVLELDPMLITSNDKKATSRKARQKRKTPSKKAPSKKKLPSKAAGRKSKKETPSKATSQKRKTSQRIVTVKKPSSKNTSAQRSPSRRASAKRSPSRKPRR